MNDNTSNTPDNASRPGNRNTRPRDEHGRFLPRNKANGEPKTIVEIANEALNNMDDDEFDHALTLARSKDTPEGNEQVETLEEWHGKKPAAKDDK